MCLGNTPNIRVLCRSYNILHILHHILHIIPSKSANSIIDTFNGLFRQKELGFIFLGFWHQTR